MKYRVTFTAIGDFALQLLQTRGSLIIFDKDVPYSYENMVLSHTKGELKGDVAVGDTLLIADREYKVAQVGEDANANLRAHGHVTLRFVEADAGGCSARRDCSCRRRDSPCHGWRRAGNRIICTKSFKRLS
mgnify:CR=1 FL=1